MGKRFVSRSNEPLWANLYTRGKDLSGIGGKVTLTPTPYKPPNQFGAWSIRTYRPFHSKEKNLQVIAQGSCKGYFMSHAVSAELLH
jgi:hypothetical protein